MEDTYGKHDSPRNAQYFANAGREYMDKYDRSIMQGQRFLLTYGQIRRKGRGLCRDRPYKPRALSTQPIRAVPAELLTQGDPGLDNDPLPDHQAAVFSHQ